MKETQEILIKMGFKNTNNNVWESEWFGTFILVKTATIKELAKFIYNRGLNFKQDKTTDLFNALNLCNKATELSTLE